MEIHSKQPFTNQYMCPLTVQTPELNMSSVAVSGQSEVSLRKLPMESWMSHLPSALWDTPLYHLAIPGRLKQHTTDLTMSWIVCVDCEWFH